IMERRRCRSRQSDEIPLHEPWAQSAVNERSCDCGDFAHGCVLFQSGSVDGSHHQPDSRPVHRYHLGTFGIACRPMDDYDGSRVFDPWLSDRAIIWVDGSWIAVVCPPPGRGVVCGSTIHTDDRPVLHGVTYSKFSSHTVAGPSCRRRSVDRVDQLVADPSHIASGWRSVAGYLS